MADIKKIKVGSTTYNIKDVVSTWGIGGTTTTLDNTLTAAQVLAELGLTAAMHFVGAAESSTSTPSAGNYIKARISTASSNNFKIIRLTTSGTATEIAAALGDVFSDGTKEYVCTKAGLYNSTASSSNMFTLLGDEGSYALNSISVTGTGALGGGGTLTQNRTITHNGYTARTLSGGTKKVVGALTSDEYGHVTAATEKTIADHSYTPAGTNAASSVTLSGGETSKLATTTVHNSHGLTFGKKLSTTSITPVGGTDTVHDTPTLVYGKKLTTGSVTGVSGSVTTHDTPTLNKSKLVTTSITGTNGTDSATLVSVPSGYTLYSAKVGTSGDEADTLVFSAVTLTDKTLAKVAGSATTVATGSLATTGTGGEVGISLTAGSSVTVPKAATGGSTFVTGIADIGSGETGTIVSGLTAGTSKTFATSGTATTVATGSLETVSSGGTIPTAVTSSGSTTVATGSVAANGGGATVVITLPTGGTAAAQTFTGTAATIAHSLS